MFRENPEADNKLRRELSLPLGCREAVWGYLDFPPPPPGARMWSKAIGPPPKKIRANARAAKASGNSYPLLPINPLWKFTLTMATDRAMQMANAATRVNRPTKTRRPPKNSVRAER